MLRVSDVFRPAPSSPKPIVVTLYLCHVPAGFPSPAEEYVECRLDVAAFLVQRPAATYFLRVSGVSMTGAGIHDGDMLVVDKSVEPTPGRVVVAAVDGQLTVKRLCDAGGGRLCLRAEADGYPPIVIGDDVDVVIWGVVTRVLHEP